MNSRRKSLVNVGGIVFNLEDPHQKRLHEHLIKHTNYSGYLKMLIDRDMQGVSEPIAALAFSQPVIYVKEPDPPAKEKVKQFGSDIYKSFT